MENSRKIWIGIIPDIFGYGIAVAEDSEDKCRKALKRAYSSWKKTYKLTDSFNVAFEHWGGHIAEVELGKEYCDNFGQ